MTRRILIGFLLVLVPLTAVSPVWSGSEPGHERFRRELSALETKLDRARKQVEQNRYDRAASTVFETFMAFEESSLHRWLDSQHASLYQSLEGQYMNLRSDLRKGRSPDRIQERLLAIQQLHDRVRQNLNPTRGSFWTATFSSFVIIFREGLEALLVIAAMVAYLVKVGAEDRKRALYLGAALAIGVSFLFAIASQTLFTLSGASMEALEGVTMLLATVVLFYVSFWLISKVEADKWKQFIESKIDRSLAAGSTLALGSVSFLVVFREGFETVLFYQALALSVNSSLLGGSGILLGLGVGVVALGVIGWFILRGSLEIPLRPFFIGTSAFLYFLAFKFAGDGIYELQEAGWLSMDPVSYVPDWAWMKTWLGIYPILQPLVLQTLLIAILAAGLVYTFRRQLVPST